jgi:hypothetical protein
MKADKQIGGSRTPVSGDGIRYTITHTHTRTHIRIRTHTQMYSLGNSNVVPRTMNVCVCVHVL